MPYSFINPNSRNSGYRFFCPATIVSCVPDVVGFSIEDYSFVWSSCRGVAT